MGHHEFMTGHRKYFAKGGFDRSGVAAVELALLLPILTAMIFGTFQYGVLLFTYNVMLNTARDGARSLAVGASTEAQVVTAAKTKLPTWVPEASWAIVASDVTTTGTNQVKTTITVPSNKATFLSFVPMPATLSVNVVMLKES